MINNVKLIFTVYTSIGKSRLLKKMLPTCSG